MGNVLVYAETKKWTITKEYTDSHRSRQNRAPVSSEVIC